MPNVNVTLAADGTFHVRTPYVGEFDYQVTLDADVRFPPWNVRSRRAGGDWGPVASYHSVDEALDWCVSTALGEESTPGYGVSLPCGRHVFRPGRIGLEDIMAGSGWAFVTHVTGHSPLDLPEGATQEDAEEAFADLVRDTTAVLGDVELAAIDEGDRTLWIADVTIPLNSLVRLDHVLETCQTLFDDEGIPHMRAFDYYKRPNVRAHSAEIVDFEAFKRARDASGDAPSSTAESGGEARAADGVQDHAG